MELPAFGLANTTTGFATFFAGCLCLALTRLCGPQPPRWWFVYWTIAATGVFTITLHGFGATASGYGPGWLWRILDTGSNIVVAWALALAVVGDFYRDTARWARPLLTAAASLGLAWHTYDSLPGIERRHLVPLGTWGGFYPGESCLIALSLTVTILFARARRRIPADARPLLGLVVAIFAVGLVFATADNDVIVPPFVAMHAIWHLVGAFGFVTLWVFNQRRFSGGSELGTT
jgi:hypothetical protein